MEELTDKPRFTSGQKLSEVRREISQRRKVYPRLVSQAKMRPAEAEMLISIMEDVARDYERSIKRREKEKT